MKDLNEECNLPPVTVFMDNQSAIAQTSSFEVREASKHVQVRHYWLKEQARSGSINFEYVKTDFNLADLHTKSFTEKRTEDLRRMIGMMTIEEFNVMERRSYSSRGGVVNKLAEYDQACEALMLMEEECEHWD